MLAKKNSFRASICALLSLLLFYSIILFLFYIIVIKLYALSLTSEGNQSDRMNRGNWNENKKFRLLNINHVVVEQYGNVNAFIVGSNLEVNGIDFVKIN